MRQRSLFFLNVILVFFTFASTGGVQAQRLHDEGRDKKAQEAAKLAEEITSRSTFENQLKNLDVLSRRDLEVYFRGAKRQMELEVSGFRTWGQVSAFVGTVKNTLNTEDFISDNDVKTINEDLEKECPARTTDLGKAICAAEKELGALKKAVKESEERGKALQEELKSRLEKIDVIESLVEKVETFLKSGSKKKETIKGLSEVFINLSRSYVNYTNKLKEIENQPKDELRLLLQRIAVETLQLEADHWKTVATIKLRRAEEQKDLHRLVEDVEFRLAQIPKCLSVDSTTFNRQKINITVSEAKKLDTCKIADGSDPSSELEIPKEEIVGYLFQTLYSAAALAARGETPMKLAELRLAQEEHRYSIRLSATLARGYELAIGSGTKRLARYYAGGLRPEKIAQLIQAAATVAIPGVIAGK
ncbi:MAG: hypothetical protein ACREBG_21960 [Pyrinomonadaceae bacterium]